MCCAEGGEVLDAGRVDGFEEPLARGRCVCCPLHVRTVLAGAFRRRTDECKN